MCGDPISEDMQRRIDEKLERAFTHGDESKVMPAGILNSADPVTAPDEPLTMETLERAIDYVRNH